MESRSLTKIKRKIRTRKKIVASGRPRLSVFRSARYLYAQIIDDCQRKTLVSVSEKDLKLTKSEAKKLTKTQRAGMVGEALVQKALKVKIDAVVFDRGYFKYHGRVKAFAESARKAGLKF